MILPIVWLPEAETELEEALAWYEAISSRLGDRFASAVRETMDAIARAPMHFALVHKEKRRAGVYRFPYGLFFVVEETRIVVIDCLHPKRHPRHWRKR